MKDIFDILGVSSREDTYTDLIVNAFNEKKNKDFRKKTIKFFGGNVENIDDVLFTTRKTFHLEGTTKIRTKLLPDMILYLPSEKKVVLIENKIFSQEGHYQTLDYASDEAVSAIKKSYTDINNIEYYYMTLHGEMAESKKFIPVSWTDYLFETIVGSTFIEQYKEIMASLLKRAEHLAVFNKEVVSGSNVSIKDLLETYNAELYNNKWVDKKAIFSKWMKPVNIIIKEKYNDIFPFITMANGSSKQYLCVYFNENWQEVNLIDENLPTKDKQYSKNIHIEFNWNSMDRAVLLIHYEPNPYLSEKEFKKQHGDDTYDLYQENRKAYVTVLHNMMNVVNADGYRKSNQKLTMAKFEFRNIIDIPYLAFEAKFLKVFDDAYELISRTNIKLAK